MEENLFEKEIEAYINKTMPEKERRAFEKKMQDNPALRRAFLRAQLVERSIAAMGKQRLREHLSGIRQDKGPLSKPRIGLASRIRLFSYSRRYKATLGILAGLIGLSLGLHLWLCPLNKISSQFFIPPRLLHVQAGQETRQEEGRAASALYAAGKLAELRRKAEAGSSPALYYLAHLYLQREAFELAAETFNRLLQEPEPLEQYAEFQDRKVLAYNLLLSEWGKDEDWAAALAKARKMEASWESPGQLLIEKQKELRDALESPLLRAICWHRLL